jgi:multiple antibiotic resistance protein
MASLVSFALVSFGSIFSIVDPFSVVPVFLALTGSQPQPIQARTALRASLTCFVVLVLFALAGGLVFSFFGITLPAFKIAGGILLFRVALDMMQARRSDTRATDAEEEEAESKDDVGLIPLGIPLLSGPGAIATVTVLAGKASDVPRRAVLFGSIAVVSVLSLLTLRSAALVARVLGQTGVNIVGRVMGLILSAVAMQFVIDGLYEAFPRLLGTR